MNCPRAVALSLFCWICSLLGAQNPAPATSLAATQTPPVATQYEINVSATPAWTDTHIDLHPGEAVQITSTGTTGGCNADGLKKSNSGVLAISSALPGALIGKLGENATPFVVGSGKQTTVSEAGHLFLGMNTAGKAPCNGSVIVKVQLTVAADVKTKLNAALQTWLSGQFGTGVPQSGGGNSSAAASSGTMTTSAPSVPGVHLGVSKDPLDARFAKELNGLPRRVNDEFNNLGDMVNFVIVGSQEQLQNLLAAADWRLADHSKEVAVVTAILQTYEKKDYVQMPMSTLYLFKRAQDFGYEQAEAYSVVASRHHFRIWKAPFTWNGQPVWIGAGTHDVGFEKDQRNGKVTHKIDPAVDGERDHVGETLEKTGKVKDIHYYLPPDPVLEARNASGGSYHSDGRLLVLFLK